MANKLSFAIAINLLTENFKRGTNQVKTAFRSMQMQILTFAAALGAGGIGLSNLVSRFVDVARETNRVTTALKNVSGSMGQFADNQRYLIDLAKKYGLEINALTGNFAKFTAAASVSGMGMDEQKKVFESVSRACTAFGMSADDSNGVFLALSQMMSKGKISSEELRLQMGERLPIALQAMAKAAGVSVGELDSLMKQGKLMSADMIPKFAEALNAMIPNVDTDNLETSVNRLKNVFTELVNDADVQSKYKALIDWLTGAIQGLGENLKNILTLVFATIAFIAVNAGTKIVKGWNAAYNQIIAGAERANVASLRATERRVAAEGTLLAKQNAEKAAVAYYEATLANGTAKEVIAAEIAKDKAIKARVSAQRTLVKAKAAEQIAIDKAVTISAQTSAIQSASGWKKAYNIMTLQASKLLLSLKAMWNSFAPAIIISALVAIYGYFKNIHDESERVKNIFSEYKAEAAKVGNTQEVVMLKEQLSIMNDKKQSQENINNAQAQLQKMLGVENKSQKELNDLVAKRVKLLEEAARAQYHANKIPEIEDQNKEIVKDFKKKYGGNSRYSIDDMVKTISDYGYQDISGLPMGFKTKYGISGSESGIRNLLDKFIGNLKIIADSKSEINKSIINTNALSKDGVNSDYSVPQNPDGKDSKKTEIQKAEEDHILALKTYKNQLDAGAITQQKYNEEVDSLNKNTVTKIGGILGKSAEANKTYAEALKGTLNPLVTEEAKVKEELSKIEKEYNDNLALAKTKLDKKMISEDEYRQSIVDAATSAANAAISIKGIGDAANGFIDKLQKTAINGIKEPVLGKRDTTFDYKATEKDKISGELDVWKTYKEELEALKDKHKELSTDLQNSLNTAIRNVDNLEDALKLAQVKEDIKKFGEEYDEALYSALQGSVSVADSLVSSFQRLKEAFDPQKETTGWEKFMAVWESINRIINQTISLIKTIENISAVIAELTGAKKKQKGLEESVAKTAIETGVQIAANQAATEAEMQTSQRKTAAATTEMAAKSTAAYASIPYAGMALAGAQIAAMTAMINAASSAVPKFANGGIVSGRTLAEVGEYPGASSNPEVIAPLSKLKSLIGDNGNNVIKTETKMIVRGSDLHLILNNYMKKTGKGFKK